MKSTHLTTRWSRYTAGLLVAALLTSCSSQGSDGAATTTAPAPPATVDVGALDPGSYPTTAAAPRAAAGSDEVGRVAEARRTLAVLTGPWQADPELTQATGDGATIITAYTSLGSVLYSSLLWGRASLGSLILAVSTERSANDSKSPVHLRNSLLRFPDDATATSIAQAITEASLQWSVSLDSLDPIASGPVQPVAIPGHPDVTGALVSYDNAGTPTQELLTATARGPFVLLQSAMSAPTPDWSAQAATLTGHTLDRQIPAIERFAPTPAAQLAGLPLDPTGIGALTVPAKSADSPLLDAALEPAAALHLEADPVTATTAYATAGVEAVGVGATTVYRTKDPGTAGALATALHDTTTTGSQPATAVAGLPASTCTAIPQAGGILTRYRCFASRDNYTFTSNSRDLTTAHHQIAAQYLMLGKP